MRPSVETCGWALASEGSPWVAQRVWPMAAVAGAGGFFASASLSFEKLSGSLDDGGDVAVGAVEGDAGGVVTPVFQSGEAGEDDLFWLLGGGFSDASDYSAHGFM